jgi:hypothetical protein
LDLLRTIPGLQGGTRQRFVVRLRV